MEEREALKELMRNKDVVEEELKAIIESLEAEGMPGVKGSLVDAEGFPRAEWDLL